jgi:hypothetical protein
LRSIGKIRRRKQLVSDKIVTEEEITELTEDMVEIVAEGPESETPDEDNEEIDSTSIEYEEIIKDYLDPGLMNGIRIIESSELSNEDMEEVPISDEEMGKYIETFSDIAQNQIITGRVIGQNEKEIIMDIGFKSEGIIPRSEFSGAEPPNLGDSIEVYLEKIEDKNGQTILSKEKAVWMKGWLKLMQIHKEEGTVNGTITRRIKGGLVVDVDGIQAFLPGSQIDVRPVQDFDNFLGKEMEFKIVKILNRSDVYLRTGKKCLYTVHIHHKATFYTTGNGAVHCTLFLMDLHQLQPPFHPDSFFLGEDSLAIFVLNLFKVNFNRITEVGRLGTAEF